MIFDIVYLLLLLTGIIILMENRLGRVIALCSVQGILLCGPVFQVYSPYEFHAWALTALILVFKTFLTPYILFYYLKQVRLFEHVRPRFGYQVSIFLFLIGLFAALNISRSIHDMPVQIDRIGLIYVILLIYLGILTFIASRHWIVLIIGFVMFENGVFLLTLILHKGLPFGTEIVSFADAFLVIVAAAVLQKKVDTFKNISGSRE